MLTAMGVVLERYKDEKNIAVQRFDIKNGKVLLWKSGEKSIYSISAFLSVGEQIALHGGMIVDVPADEIILNPKTAPIIEALWSVFKADKHYNTNVKLLQRAMKLDRDERELFVDIDINEFKSAEPDDRAFGWLTEFLQFLKNDGIIDFWGTQNNKISFAFNNSTAKELFGKSGNVLEMKVFKVAKEIKDPNGVPYYTDLKRSVIIDWDGKSGNNKTGDTKNEIDCVLMKNLVPVFISCKGGDIEEAELYKLDAVANRFGGKYAKKVLISTNHGKDEISAAYFRKRAQDMNITLFENVHLFTDSEFFDMIKELA